MATFLEKHEKIETRGFVLLVLTLVTVSIGGIVEIAPLFTIESTIERVDGVRPYSPLELAGRNIYLREGCYNCHSQMIRPFRDEAERYGHYSLAAESMYDHPFQWGSKRTGPDLARVGGKYSNEWQAAHLADPRCGRAREHHAALRLPRGPRPAVRRRGGPPEHAADRGRALHGRGDRPGQRPTSPTRPRPTPTTARCCKRYPKAAVGDFDGQPGRLTEMDALIAYLQVLGRMVDFTAVRTEDLKQ